MTPNELLDALTASISFTKQQEAIMSSMADGHSLIVTARAGVGKTFVLENGARRLCKARPQVRGLYIVFNVKNKKEAEKRFPPQFTCITMNGLGHRAWQPGRPRLNLQPRKVFDLVDSYLEKNRLSATWDEKQQFSSLLNAARTLNMVPDGLPGIGFISDDEEGWAQVADWAEATPSPDTVIIARSMLKASIASALGGLIDFTDQIYMPVCFGGTWPQADIVLGDEVQDWSPANHKMVRLIRAPQKVLVGDPKQAIYAFRGAMTDSMSHLEDCMPKGTEWKHLSLTKTFRCGKKIVARQYAFCPDFSAAEQNEEGEVIRWPLKPEARSPDAAGGWTPSDVPNGSAILCRNNAPLVSCALKFLAARRKVTVLGRDFADRLKKDISKATKGAPGAMTIDDVLKAVRAFYEAKLGAKRPTAEQLEAIQDRVAAISALSDGCERLSALSDAIASVFSDEIAPVTFATGHKAKGLEWDWVMHLDPWRIPSKWSESSPEAYAQELNLRYVIETRAKHTLVLANLEDLET